MNSMEYIGTIGFKLQLKLSYIAMCTSVEALDCPTNTLKALMVFHECLTLSYRENLPVKVRGAVAGDLLLATGGIEEHGLIVLGPWDVHIFLGSLSCNKAFHDLVLHLAMWTHY